jgi:hypothetical protein
LQIFLYPQKLWGLHFWGDTPTAVLQHRGIASINSISLIDSSMVHPHDDVPSCITTPRNRNRGTISVNSNKGASSGEAKADDILRGNACQRARRFYSSTHRKPDIRRRLLYAVSLFPHLYGAARRTQQLTLLIKQACINR